MTTQSKRWLHRTGGLIAIATQMAWAPDAMAAGEQASTEVAAGVNGGCRTAILETEHRLNIPNGLLMAMALVESGRDGDAWPHTLTFGRRTTYPESVEVAVRQLRDDQGRLRRNLHVGCLQLSMRYHHAAFTPVERILEPEANVGYAAEYLVQFSNQGQDWGAAVQHYNGGPRHRSSGYLCRVWRHLIEIDPGSATVLHAGGCAQSRRVEVSAAVRAAFHPEQVAEGAD